MANHSIYFEQIKFINFLKNYESSYVFKKTILSLFTDNLKEFDFFELVNKTFNEDGNLKNIIGNAFVFANTGEPSGFWAKLSLDWKNLYKDDKGVKYNSIW